MHVIGGLWKTLPLTLKHCRCSYDLEEVCVVSCTVKAKAFYMTPKGEDERELLW